MYKASQQALAQETNLQLVEIRKAEIDYYVSIMATLGTQSALLGGFTYGIFTLTQPSEEPWAADCYTAYHVFSGICIAASIHVIIVTLLIGILGPGLALNGPVGSMARASDAMRSELDQVIISFFIMIFGFTCSTVMSFWAVMDQTAAILCTAVFGVAARAWWYYSRRIYLKLYWDRTQFTFNEGRDSEATNPINMISGNPSAISAKSLAGKPSNTSMFSSPNFEILMEGYVKSKAILSGNDFSKGVLEKKYLVLNNRGLLSVFKSREQYRNDAKSSSERPLDILDFKITIHNAELFQVLFTTADDEVHGRRFFYVFENAEDFELWMDAFNFIREEHK